MSQSSLNDGLIQLIQHARTERSKAAERMNAAKQEMDRWELKIQGYETTLRDFNEFFGGSEERTLLPVDSALHDRYAHRTVRDMVRLWMQDHSGYLAGNELVTTLTNAGLFRNKTQAAGSIYPILQRMQKGGEIEKVEPGRYRSGSRFVPPEPLRLEFSDEDSISR